MKSIEIRCCGACKWHKYDDEWGDWSCLCKASEYYGCVTEYRDACDDWEER